MLHHSTPAATRDHAEAIEMNGVGTVVDADELAQQRENERMAALDAEFEYADQVAAEIGVKVGARFRGVTTGYEYTVLAVAPGGVTVLNETEGYSGAYHAGAFEEMTRVGDMTFIPYARS